MILHIEKLTPDVYTEDSRDFLLISRIYNSVFNGVKYDAETIPLLLDTKIIREEFLPLLQTKLGFDNSVTLTNEEIRYILRVFPYILRHKGSLRAIKEMVNMCLKLYHVNAQVKVDCGTGGAVINNVTLDAHSILIGINTVLRSTKILKDLCRYVLPPGFSLYVYFYQDLPVTNIFDYEDEAEFVFQSDNIQSRLRTTTAYFRTSSSNPWQSLSQFWGAYDKLPQIVLNDVYYRDVVDGGVGIKATLASIATSSLSPGDVVRTVSLDYGTTVNSKLDLLNLDSYKEFGKCVVVSRDESNQDLKTFYTWGGSEFVEASVYIRYWLLQQPGLLTPSYCYDSDNPGTYSWYELYTYMTGLFLNNDFLYLNNDGYYRYVADTANRIHVKDTYTADHDYILIPGIAKYSFYVNELTFLSKTGITTTGYHTISVRNVQTNTGIMRYVYVDSSTTPNNKLTWSEDGKTNFGLDFGAVEVATTGTKSTEYEFHFTIIQTNDTLASGTWTKINNADIHFISGPLFSLNSESKVVSTVNTLTLNSVDITSSSHFLGIYNNLTELTDHHITPSLYDMAIVNTQEYIYVTSAWQPLRFVGYRTENSLDQSELENFDLVGAISGSNRVYFRYTGSDWQRMRCRGSVTTSVIDNPMDNDFVNPTNSTHSFYLDNAWNSLGTYLGSKSKFPQSPSTNDYLYLQGSTYYVMINNQLIDVTDVAHILESYKLNSDGREI